MEDKKYKETQIIEPEILDENGDKIILQEEAAEERIKESLNPVRKPLMALLGTVAAVLSGFMMLCVFAVFFVVMAVPFLIMRLFGCKPKTQIFKFRA